VVPASGEALAVSRPVWGGAPRVEREGPIWRAPVLTRLRIYRPVDVDLAFRRGEGTPLSSREGAPVRLTLGARLAPDPAGAAALDGRLGARYGDPRALAGALAEFLRPAAARIAYDDLLSLTAGARPALEEALRAGAASLGLRVDRVRDLEVWPEVYPEGVAPAGPGTRRILLVGLDGADWTILDPLMARGAMPNLARLVARGSRARMKSLTPMLSPILWTSMATGKRPEKHGIIDFLAEDARTGASVPVTSTMRKARAFWQILSSRGITVGTVAWWATWPAERVLGFQVTDRVAYQLFGAAGEGEAPRGRTHPEGLMLTLARLGDEAAAAAREDAIELLGRPPAPEEPEEQALAGILASTRIYHAAALRLLREYRPQVAAVYYEGTDTVAHHFMRYAPPRMPGVASGQVERWGEVVAGYYGLQDRLLGELLGAAGPGATVLVVSDHGFKSGPSRPQTDPRIGMGPAADWHHRFGVWAAAGPGIRRGVEVEDVSILDVTPTLLAMLGLPAAGDMDGAPALAALEEDAIPEAARAASVASYEEAGEAAVPAPADLDPAEAAVEREMIEKLTALGYLGQTGANAENNTGITLLRHGRFAEAEAAFRAAVRREPAYHAARVNVARALIGAGRLEEALEELRAVRAADANVPDVENLIGNIHMERGDAPEAERTFRRALDRDPGNPHLWNSLGIVLAEQGRSAEAVEAYRRVLAVEPDYAEAINNIGLVLRGQGRPEEAAETFRRAVAADPDFAGSYNNLGLVLQDLGRPAEALAAYDEGLRRDPDNAVILNNRGSALLALGRVEEARKAFEGALAADPAYASAHNNLGAVLGLLGDAEAEFEEYLKAIEADPRSADARFNLALNLARRGRHAEAVRGLEDLLAMEPGHARGRLELGLLLAAQGRLAEAIGHLETLRAAAPRWAAGRSALARILAEAGRTREALREARAALAVDPNQPEAALLVERLGATNGSTP
jgi:tetratricopeptide (TPR) repeat protein